MARPSTAGKTINKAVRMDTWMADALDEIGSAIEKRSGIAERVSSGSVTRLALLRAIPILQAEYDIAVSGEASVLPVSTKARAARVKKAAGRGSRRAAPARKAAS